jgi:hypothetical protein
MPTAERPKQPDRPALEQHLDSGCLVHIDQGIDVPAAVPPASTDSTRTQPPVPRHPASGSAPAAATAPLPAHRPGTRTNGPSDHRQRRGPSPTPSPVAATGLSARAGHYTLSVRSDRFTCYAPTADQHRYLPLATACRRSPSPTSVLKDRWQPPLRSARQSPWRPQRKHFRTAHLLVSGMIAVERTARVIHSPTHAHARPALRIRAHRAIEAKRRRGNIY